LPSPRLFHGNPFDDADVAAFWRSVVLRDDGWDNRFRT
jgi:hypothetical protein